MNNEIRWKQRFDNFEKAYNKLRQISEIKNRSEWEDMALIQAFEFTFELTWKTLKDYLEEMGFTETLSPKSVLRQAYQSDYIQNGESWLEGLKVRNNTVHVYDESVLEDTIRYIQDDFMTIVEKFYRDFSKAEV